MILRVTSAASGSDARECERITHAHARTFALASRLLPMRKRRASYALYAFCRIADDLVDQADVTGSDYSVEALADQLRLYRSQLHAALNGEPSSAIFREVAWVAETFDVAAAPLFELLDGVARDLVHVTPDRWLDLKSYCEGVASSVGEMCTYVFGVAGDASHRDRTMERAVGYARTLGTAMQLTNILRDVGEDARRGRCYLPLDELQAHGLSVDEVLKNSSIARDARWKPMMQFQVQRARDLYTAALPGIAMLQPDSQGCAAACASGYASILSAIERQHYDTITTRARIGRAARLHVLWNAWRYRADTSMLADIGAAHAS